MKLLTMTFALAILGLTSYASAQDMSGTSASDSPTAEFTSERTEKGRQTYKQLCLRCHGPEMNGGNNTFNLRLFPLEQRERFVNSVMNGKRAMPSWKSVLSEEEVMNLWAYVGTRGGTLQR
jgi:mono/diheme cytochrome c family protein